MKYLIVLGDGMADKNIPELDNRTPLDYADTPAMDKYSKLSEIGMVRKISLPPCKIVPNAVS